MASENLDKRFELIQETFSNPEFKTKLGRILSEMTPSELAFVIESSPPHAVSYTHLTLPTTTPV